MTILIYEVLGLVCIVCVLTVFTILFVLIASMYGVSRSATIIAAYLMKMESLSCAAALQSIANIKPSIKLVCTLSLCDIILVFY